MVNKFHEREVEPNNQEAFNRASQVEEVLKGLPADFPIVIPAERNKLGGEGFIKSLMNQIFKLLEDFPDGKERIAYEEVLRNLRRIYENYNEATFDEELEFYSKGSKNYYKEIIKKETSLDAADEKAKLYAFASLMNNFLLNFHGDDTITYRRFEGMQPLHKDLDQVMKKCGLTPEDVEYNKFRPNVLIDQLPKTYGKSPNQIEKDRQTLKERLIILKTLYIEMRKLGYSRTDLCS